MSDTQLIKDKIDIVDFINEYVPLKPAGVNHKGSCPFHQEKTPSFMVNRERQSWHCFGCSKGGDIFTFVQDIEGMDFLEALRMLADRAGINLTFNGKGSENASKKAVIKEINTKAARFFHNFLVKMPSSKQALDYLSERGIKLETIEQWQIGFVPDQWDLLTQYLLKKGYGIDDLVASGLTIRRDGANGSNGKGFYDRFRGRIMFPICDVHGQVVGFTGRILIETERSGGKYVNTPQTLVYDKSSVVFGLYMAKKEIKSKDLVVVVEGQTDVIVSHQAGMKNVVASSGTALTEQQVKLLKRYSSNMNMAFDADEAGQKAAKRGIDIALGEGMSVKVIQIPEGSGKDPDECIRISPEIWFKSVENAQWIMDWYLNKALYEKDLSNPKQKQDIVDEILPEICRIPFAVERDHWLRELSSRIGVEAAVLREDISRLKEKQKSKIKDYKPDEMKEPKNEIKPEAENRMGFTSRLDLLAERLIILLLRFPELFGIHSSVIDSKYISPTKYAWLYNLIDNLYNKENSLNIDKLREAVDQDSKENIIDVLKMKGDLEYLDLSEKEAENEIKQLAVQINGEWLRVRRAELQRKIMLAEKTDDRKKLEELLKEFQNL